MSARKEPPSIEVSLHAIAKSVTRIAHSLESIDDKLTRLTFSADTYSRGAADGGPITLRTCDTGN